MLFSVLNGTPCIVLNNKTGKVFGVADWLDDTNMIVRANSLSEVLEKLKRTTIWEHKKYDREKLLNYFEKMAEVIRRRQVCSYQVLFFPREIENTLSLLCKDSER